MRLVISPKTDLEFVDEEIQRVINFLSPRVLLGVVTLAQVVDELQARPYDVIWFACHGDEKGIHLSDGTITAQMIAQLLRANKPRLLFLNTCSSLSLAMEIHDAINCQVIGTITEIPDREAFVTGSAFARAIAQGLSIDEAYNISRPSQNRTYVLLNGSIRLNEAREGDDTNQLLLLIIRRQDEWEKRILHQIGKMEDRVKENYHGKLDLKRAAAWIIGYSFFSISLYFLPHGLPTRYDIQEPGTIIILFLIQFIAAGFLMWGLGLDIPFLKNKEDDN